jgi:hypothetical protein
MPDSTDSMPGHALSSVSGLHDELTYTRLSNISCEPDATTLSQCPATYVGHLNFLPNLLYTCTQTVHASPVISSHERHSMLSCTTGTQVSIIDWCAMMYHARAAMSRHTNP